MRGGYNTIFQNRGVIMQKAWDYFKINHFLIGGGTNVLSLFDMGHMNNFLIY